MPEGRLRFSKETKRWETPETLIVERARMKEVAAARAAQAADDATIKFRIETQSLMSDRELEEHRVNQARIDFAESTKLEHTPHLSPLEAALLAKPVIQEPEDTDDARVYTDAGGVQMTPREHQSWQHSQFVDAISAPRVVTSRAMPTHTQQQMQDDDGPAYYDSEAKTYVTRQPTAPREPGQQL